jgi:hypothetical protein
MSSSGELEGECEIPVTGKNRQARRFLAIVILVTGISIADPVQFHDAFAKDRIVYTPASGSIERKEILDVMRLKVKELHQFDVIFVVKTMNVCDGWAWVHALPQSKDSSSRYEDFYALLHKKKGRWTIAEIPCTEPDNSDCIDSPHYFKKLERRLPGLPKSIFVQDNQ